jgi:nucleoside phosphorylase
MDPERLKILFAGVAASAALGLLLGDLMTPDFVALAELQAAEPLPQIPVPRRAQVMGQEIAAEWTSLTGDIPDYVIGTDWSQPAAVALAVAAQNPPAPRPEPASARDAPPAPSASAAQAMAQDQADLHAQPAYPSQGGDILAGLDPHGVAPPSLN